MSVPIELLGHRWLGARHGQTVAHPQDHLSAGSIRGRQQTKLKRMPLHLRRYYSLLWTLDREEGNTSFLVSESLACRAHLIIHDRNKCIQDNIKVTGPFL